MTVPLIPETMSFILAASEGAMLTVWGVSLVLGVVVIVVVGVLLALVRRTAAQIDAGAEAIWTHGQLVANNTIQIPIFLQTTNDVVGQIRGGALDIVVAAKAIHEHAEGCPGCPACVLSSRW